MRTLVERTRGPSRSGDSGRRYQAFPACPVDLTDLGWTRWRSWRRCERLKRRGGAPRRVGCMCCSAVAWTRTHFALSSCHDATTTPSARLQRFVDCVLRSANSSHRASCRLRFQDGNSPTKLANGTVAPVGFHRNARPLPSPPARLDQRESDPSLRRDLALKAARQMHGRMLEDRDGRRSPMRRHGRVALFEVGGLRRPNFPSSSAQDHDHGGLQHSRARRLSLCPSGTFVAVGAHRERGPSPSTFIAEDVYLS